MLLSTDGGMPPHSLGNWKLVLR